MLEYAKDYAILKNKKNTISKSFFKNKKKKF